MSLRRVRSPDAPKMTTAQASPVRSSTSPRRRGLGAIASAMGPEDTGTAGKGLPGTCGVLTTCASGHRVVQLERTLRDLTRCLASLWKRQVMRIMSHPEGRLLGYVELKVASRIYKLPV